MLTIDVTNLLPQKYPFKMVDFLVEVGEVLSKTNFKIQANNVLVSNGYFTEGGLIENMAQSAAASSGYYYTSQQKAVPIGYIGAIKKIEIHNKPKVGDLLETSIETLGAFGAATIVSGKIFCKKDLIATCELTIFVSN